MKIRYAGTAIEVQTPAKVNLFLELLGRREDGFHQLETIISSVSLYDTLRFQVRNDEKISLNIHQPSGLKEDIPTDSRNLIVRAFEKVRELAASRSGASLRFKGVDIDCTKRIPSQAGLGGASGNAAGAVWAANRIWNCGLSFQDMHGVCEDLGSDVPYFLQGGVSVCRGRGEIVSPIRSSFGNWLVIAKPPVGLSTASVFSQCTMPDEPRSAEEMIRTITTGKWNKTTSLMFNRLQSFASQLTDWIESLANSFTRTCSLGHQMSGSGSSYFGFFPGRIAALRAAKCLASRHHDARVFACQTLNEFHFRSSVELGDSHGNN